MKLLAKWKAWLIPLGLMIAIAIAWPVTAGPSTKINVTDNMSENIGAVTYTDDADWTASSSASVLMGAVATPGDTVTSGDVGGVAMDTARNLLVSLAADPGGLASKTLIRAEFDGNPATGAYQEIIAASAGDQYFIVELSITQDTQNKMELVADSASGETGLWKGFIPAPGSVMFAMSEQATFVVTDEKNLAVQNNTGGSINMAGHVVYYIE